MMQEKNEIFNGFHIRLIFSHFLCEMDFSTCPIGILVVHSSTIIAKIGLLRLDSMLKLPSVYDMTMILCVSRRLLVSIC